MGSLADHTRTQRSCSVLNPTCRVLPDLMGRTLQIVTPGKEELVCCVQKSTKALIMEVSRVLPLTQASWGRTFVAVHMTGRKQSTAWKSLLKVTGAVCRVYTAHGLFVSLSAGCSGRRVGDAD